MTYKEVIIGALTQLNGHVRLIEVAKKSFIKSHGHLYCEVCGFDFSKVYGDLGNDF